jgi:hypothetical protein
MGEVGFPATWGSPGQKVMKIADEANKKHPYSQRGLY